MVKYVNKQQHHSPADVSSNTDCVEHLNPTGSAHWWTYLQLSDPLVVTGQVD